MRCECSILKGVKVKEQLLRQLEEGHAFPTSVCSRVNVPAWPTVLKQLRSLGGEAIWAWPQKVGDNSTCSNVVRICLLQGAVVLKQLIHMEAIKFMHTSLF